MKPVLTKKTAQSRKAAINMLQIIFVLSATKLNDNKIGGIERT